MTVLSLVIDGSIFGDFLHSLKNVSSSIHLILQIINRKNILSLKKPGSRKFNKITVSTEISTALECFVYKVGDCTNELEVITSPEVMMTALQGNENHTHHSYYPLEVTIQLGFREFDRKLNIVENWKETVEHFCKIFKRFTVCLYDPVDPDYEFAILHETHSHGNCLPIETVAAIYKRIGDLGINNFKFAASFVVV